MVGLLALGTALVGNPVLPLVTKELVPPGKLISLKSKSLFRGGFIIENWCTWPNYLETCSRIENIFTI